MMPVLLPNRISIKFSSYCSSSLSMKSLPRSQRLPQRYASKKRHLSKIVSRSSEYETKVAKINVTKNLADRNPSNNESPFIHTAEETKQLVDKLLQRTEQMMDPSAANVVAFSGGVDSSLVAALVHKSFKNNPVINNEGSVQAVIGISNAVSQTQIDMARQVADTIGIPLREVTTAEGNDEAYVRNDGHACFVCKTHLYSTLESVANEIKNEQELHQNENANNAVILYNGTNSDDTQDPTRLGLLAASNFRVLSPLDRTSKDQVRQASKYLGLPNWNAAASPCLRSRLAMGVQATERHLKAVEMAEDFVRRVLGLDETRNVRVRMLAGGRAMVELDGLNGDDPAVVLRKNGFEEFCINQWGFKSFGGVRGFKTGSVAAIPFKNQ